MPTEEQELDWQKIMEIGARTIGSELASAIVAEMFGEKDNTQELISQAIEEICSRMAKIVDNAFMQEYIADTNSIASRLTAYQETNDETILDELFSDASDTVHRLRRFDSIESITACNYISTLHLVIIQAMSEHNAGYKETLSRTGKDYAEWSRSKAGRIGELTRNSLEEAWPYQLDPNGNNFSTYVIKTQGAYIGLIFRSFQPDKWAATPTYFDSEPIVMKDNITDFTEYLDKKDLFGHYTTLHPKIKENRMFQEKVKNLNVELHRKSQDYMNNRTAVSDTIERTIHNACDKWQAL